MQVPDLTLRIPKGSPLTAAEGDNNFLALRNFGNALSARIDVTLNEDGTLKIGTITNEDVITDRLISVSKLKDFFIGDLAGTDTYTLTLSPVLSAYAKGQVYFLRIPTTNTTASTINVDTKGAVAIKKAGTLDLVAGDLQAGSWGVFIYDDTGGAKFHLVGTIGGTLSHGSYIDEVEDITSTWTVPSGVYCVDVTCVGGGGGGGDTAGGGGAGATFKRLTVTPGHVYTYHVGKKGLGIDSGGAVVATDGADTTFDTTIIGGGGKHGTGAAGGIGGIGSGGDVNLKGSSGALAGFGRSQPDKPNGGNAALGFGFGGAVAGSATLPVGYGAGGCGDNDPGGGYVGQNGTGGIIIIEW